MKLFEKFRQTKMFSSNLISNKNCPIACTDLNVKTPWSKIKIKFYRICLSSVQRKRIGGPLTYDHKWRWGRISASAPRVLCVIHKEQTLEAWCVNDVEEA